MRWRTIGLIFGGFTALGAATHDPIPFILGFVTCGFLSHVRAGERLAAIFGQHTAQSLAVPAQPLESSAASKAQPDKPTAVVTSEASSVASEAPESSNGPSREQCLETERKLSLALVGMGYKKHEAKQACKELHARIAAGDDLATLVRVAVQAAHGAN